MYHKILCNDSLAVKQKSVTITTNTYGNASLEIGLQNIVVGISSPQGVPNWYLGGSDVNNSLWYVNINNVNNTTITIKVFYLSLK